jgi:hypothetical protein
MLVGFHSLVEVALLSWKGLDISAAFLLFLALDCEAGVLIRAEAVAAGAGVENVKVSETDTFGV